MEGIDISKFQKRGPAKQKRDAINLSELLNTEILIFGSQWKDAKKQKLYSNLHILLDSGLDIKTVLDLSEEEQSTAKDKKIIHEVRKKVIHGINLSQALQESNKFSPYEYYSLRIGEESGKVLEILKELSSFFAQKVKLEKKIISALSYPILVLITAVLAIFFMMTFIVPMFSQVFLRFGGELPLLTQLVIQTAKFLSSHAYSMLLVLTFLATLAFFFRKHERFRKYSSFVILRIPVIGTILKRVFLARFCQSMRILISSKVPLVQSLELVAKMIQFYPMEVALKESAKAIILGEQLHESLSKHRIFNNRVISMIKIGEEVNKLDTMFGQLADQYGNEVETRVELINSLLEPLLIIFLGLTVGIILVAMYLPLFKLSLNFGV